MGGPALNAQDTAVLEDTQRQEGNYNNVSGVSTVVLQLSRKTSEEGRRGLCSGEQILYWYAKGLSLGSEVNFLMDAPLPSPGIFLTQESNWSLLHWKWVLYQLSY